jgi:hypothetical protein
MIEKRPGQGSIINPDIDPVALNAHAQLQKLGRVASGEVGADQGVSRFSTHFSDEFLDRLLRTSIGRDEPEARGDGGGDYARLPSNGRPLTGPEAVERDMILH